MAFALETCEELGLFKGIYMKIIKTAVILSLTLASVAFASGKSSNCPAQTKGTLDKSKIVKAGDAVRTVLGAPKSNSRGSSDSRTTR